MLLGNGLSKPTGNVGQHAKDNRCLPFGQATGAMAAHEIVTQRYDLSQLFDSEICLSNRWIIFNLSLDHSFDYDSQNTRQ